MTENYIDKIYEILSRTLENRVELKDKKIIVPLRSKTVTIKLEKY